MSEPSADPATAPVRVEVTRSGGFAGISRRAVLDAAALPPAEAARLSQLAHAAERAGPPTAADGVVDRFSYDLTISRGAQHTQHSYAETALPADVRTLVDLVLTPRATIVHD